MTVFATYGEWLRAGGASDRTVNSRLSGARRLLRLAGVDEPMQLTNLHSIHYVASAEAAWSRYTYYGHVAALARFLEAMGESPSFMIGVPRPKAPRSLPRPIDVNELGAALALSRGRERAMLLLASYAGLRVAEIATVAGQDVTEGGVFVRGKGGRQDMVPTHPVLWRCALTYPRDGYWFPGSTGDGHLSRLSVWHSMRDALDRIGSTATPHQVRHFYGTALLDAGANIRVVQELMRHANLSSTQVYTRVRDEDRRRAIEALPEIA